MDSCRELRVAVDEGPDELEEGVEPEPVAAVRTDLWRWEGVDIDG